MSAVAALTERMLLGSLRDDLPFAILAPAGNFVIFNIALRNVIDTRELSYPQYVLPVIIVQVMLLSALATADRASRDQRLEFGTGLRTLPISAVAPLMARMLYCLVHGSVALVTALVIGYVFGFRMSGGPVYAVAFVVLVLTLTLALSLGADALGAGMAKTATGRSGATSQLLLVPQLLLVMLSTGMAPADAFPGWLFPFVRYQPVSEVTTTLRGFTTGHVVASNLATSLAWCLGLLVLFGAIAVQMQRRPQ